MPPAMMLHIAAGGVGLAAGFAALAFRKGEPLHRLAGTAFFVAMLFMSGVGAIMAAYLPNRPTVLVGVLTFYLVATAWMTVRREEGRVGRFEVAALAVVVVVAALNLLAGLLALQSPKGAMDQIPYQMIFVFGGVATLAAITDLRVIRRGGVAGAPRIARHLWRMCAALLIATSSFFFGQQKVLPEALHGSPVLFIPSLVVLVSLVFWLFRVRFSKAFASSARPRTLEAAG